MLIEAYENQHYPIGPADPVEAIKFRMEQQGLTTRDLEAYIGSSGRVSEVLNRKRSLSLRMVKRLHDGLHIPYESLLSKVA
jgi:HTH-type transcriptional regulator/antitoxin HigA